VDGFIKKSKWVRRSFGVSATHFGLVEGSTPATSTTFRSFNVHLDQLNISKHSSFLALFKIINLNP